METLIIILIVIAGLYGLIRCIYLEKRLSEAESAFLDICKKYRLMHTHVDNYKEYIEKNCGGDIPRIF
jgi:hypothetical protein